jgi:hypothetical protein
MRSLLFTTIVVVGCTKQNPDFCPAHPDDPRCGGITDGGTDSPDGDNGIDADLTWGTGDFAVLLPTAGPATLTLNSFSTSGGNPCIGSQAWVNASQPDACFVVAANVTIQDATITGSRPLVIVGTESITIKGKLDIASHNTAGVLTNGPGVANPPTGACGGTVPQTDSGGGGGGAGGSFQTKGGNGGTGNGAAATVPNGGVAAAAMTMPMLLRAGCSGQTGAAGGTGGPGGGGGGAIYLLGGTKIDLSTAVINASGAGGAPGTSRGGGGGGGSGGMVVLYVDSAGGTITTTAATRIVANGGAGGGGGAQGGDPDVTMATSAAIGAGASGGCSTNGGGNGGFLTTPGGNGGPGCNSGGGTMGGGGGGGVGYIQSNLAVGQGTYSPTVTLP